MLRRVLTLASAAALAAVGITVASAPAQASACPLGYECSTTYYDGPDRTTAVGGKLEFCDGDVRQWGERSSYISYNRREC